MERRSRDRKRKNRSYKVKYLVELLCMAGILAAVLCNQKEIMSWMEQLGNTGIDSRKESVQENVSEKEAESIPEAVTQVELDTSEMTQDQEKFHSDTPMLEKQKRDDGEAHQVAMKLKKDTRKKKLQAIADTEVHGAYYSARLVSNADKVDQIIASIEGTGINAVVIDVKDDTGKITFAVNNTIANKIGAVSNQIWDVREMVEKFHEKNIYVIGRVVAFRDPILAVSMPAYAVQNTDGTVFYDRAGDTWLNPYNEHCWEYLLEIAEEAVEYGFDEIQFDYVRFSTEAKESRVSFGVDSENYTKTEVITDFVQYAVQKLHQKDAKVSADVFGAIINSEVDAKTVGQDYVELSRYLDFICPMIYPSHYADGCYGLEVPDLQPYELILGALNDSVKELLAIDEEQHCAKVRPWLQDFTASWKKTYQSYGLEQVTEQIQGVYDSGYSQWLLWNSSGRYSAMNK